MFGSDILDVAIGLTLLFLLLSAMASALREALEGWFKTRSQHLERGIRELLQDPDGSWLARGIYEHPLVAGLYKGAYTPRPPGWGRKNALQRLFGRSNLPSYIPAPNFAAALLDVIARGPVVSGAAMNDEVPTLLTVDVLRTRAAGMSNPYLQRALLAALDRSDGDLNRAQANLEAWFNSSMDRVSGWYKRRTQEVLLILGLGLAVGLNVNTITVARFLLHDSTAREALVAHAGAVSRDSGVVRAPYDSLYSKLQSFNLPIGWAPEDSVPRMSLGEGSRAWPDFWLPLLGWLLTGFAVSLGAPFWFDVLNKFMVIRSTVKPHEKSPEEDSEDRQRKGAPKSSHRIGGPLPDDGTDAEHPGDGGGGAGTVGRAGSPTTEVAGPGANAGVDAAEDFQPHQWTSGNPEEGEL